MVRQSLKSRYLIFLDERPQLALGLAAEPGLWFSVFGVWKAGLRDGALDWLGEVFKVNVTGRLKARLKGFYDQLRILEQIQRPRRSKLFTYELGPCAHSQLEAQGVLPGGAEGYKDPSEDHEDLGANPHSYVELTGPTGLSRPNLPHRIIVKIKQTAENHLASSL